MRVTVTGGAGYIGSHATRMLLDAGHQVQVIDDLSTGHRAAVDGRATFVSCRLHQTEVVQAALEAHRSEAVLHFAAWSLVGQSVEQPLAYWENNVGGTLSLLQAMAAAQVERLVFSSTAAAYGEPDRVPIRESDPILPINPYGASKAAAERAIRDLVEARPSFACAVLRYFNVVGCHPSGDLGEDHRPETHLVPIVIDAALGRRDSISVFGADYPTPDGTCVRDYVHVCDLIDAHLLALNALTSGQTTTFNVGLGRGISVRQVVDAVAQVTDTVFDVREAPRRPGDPATLWTDPEAIGRLGWRPRFTDLGEMIRTAWQWRRDHPHGYGARDDR